MFSNIFIKLTENKHLKYTKYSLYTYFTQSKELKFQAKSIIH